MGLSKSAQRDLRDKAKDRINPYSSSPASTEESGKGKTLREKAMMELHGPDANPSMLGDPISIKAETSDNLEREAEEAGMARGKSKL